MIQKCKEKYEGCEVLYKLVPDEVSEIQQALIAHCGLVDVVLTTGGTGFSKRDVTPEATRLVIDKEAPGLVFKMLSDGLKTTDFASLSRMVAGFKANTLIINFPGSLGAVNDCFQSISGLLPHAVSILNS